MQFGMRDEFIYCECADCGCLQLTTSPTDLSKYYPKSYFSFTKQEENFFKERLNVYRDRYCLRKSNLSGKILFKKFGEPTYIGWLNRCDINFQSKILDIGCGTGRLLYRMGNAGFKNLVGVDPYISENIFYSNGVTILKKSFLEIDDKFDLIMMHHSLEHMNDQHRVFKKLGEIIPEGKSLLIRIPVCSSFAWEKYRENWLALDAPRHFFLHSKDSLKYIAGKYGFEITEILYDSRSIQLLGQHTI